jgi:hypothetical protein
MATRRYPKLPQPPRHFVAPRSPGHHVADFNTLDDLIAHARDELGATHVVVDQANTKLYFPRGGQHPYEEASVWRKSGYWHAQGPGARTGVHELPEEVQPIGGGQAERRAAEVARKQDPTGGYGEANVKRWMRSHVAEYVDPLTGEVNTTKLAEGAAYEANRSEWLDDSTHPIWDWALEEAERYERAHRGAPGRHTVRDYIAVDRRGRTTAGPFKTYGDAKSAAGPADVVQFVRPGAAEARRTPRRQNAPVVWTRQNTQINTWFERDRASVVLETLDGTSIIEWWDEAVDEAVQDGFLDSSDWHGSAIEYANYVGAQPQDGARETVEEAPRGAVREIHGYNIEVFFADEHLARKFERQIEDALQLPLISQGPLRDGYRLEYGPIEGSGYLKLERVIYSKVGNAGRVRLVQVMYGDAKSAAGPADVVQFVSREGVEEARRTGGTRGGPARKYYVVDQVQNRIWVQVGHFATKDAAEQFRAKLHGQTRIKHAFPSGHDHPPIAEEARRRPKAKRSVRRRR